MYFMTEVLKCIGYDTVFQEKECFHEILFLIHHRIESVWIKAAYLQGGAGEGFSWMLFDQRFMLGSLDFRLCQRAL